MGLRIFNLKNKKLPVYILFSEYSAKINLIGFLIAFTGIVLKFSLIYSSY